MSGKRTSSFLQLQLGQEVIYLLLSLFALLVLVLAFFSSSQLAEISKLNGIIKGIESQGGDAYKKNLDLARLVAELRKEIEQLRKQLTEHMPKVADADQKAAAKDRDIIRLTAENQDLKSRLAFAMAELTKLTDKPPIINLSEASGYTFRVGENLLSPEFQKKLTDTIIPELLNAGSTYRADVIEVIGHTDEQRVPERFSNLDTRLLGFLHGDAQQSLLVGDNTGLGMSRAAAVARHLMLDPRIKQNNYTVLPVNAGAKMHRLAGVKVRHG